MSPLLPDVFPGFWTRFQELADIGEVTSTREVLRELNEGAKNHVLDWCNQNKAIFATPSADETAFLTKIFKVRHFQQLIGENQRFRGNPVADPFVIARAFVLDHAVF